MHTAVATHDESKTQYFWVWGVLLLLTAVEVVLAYKQVFQPLQMLEALMILSIIKSALIIGYFMHLKYEIACHEMGYDDRRGRVSVPDVHFLS